MAAFINDIRYRARQPRLGRWWRLWIAGNVWLPALVVAIVTGEDGWPEGGLPALAACGICSALVLALGFTIDWIRNGKQP
ncbi:MAG TPA: hypothetical protein VMQ93_13170 [Novosphingobium sp.]|nr:hypothetical protein [Novosphingobium sp.]